MHKFLFASCHHIPGLGKWNSTWRKSTALFRTWPSLHTPHSDTSLPSSRHVSRTHSLTHSLRPAVYASISGGSGCHTFLVLFSPGLRPLNFLFLPRKHLRKLAIFTPFRMHDCHGGEYYIYGPQSNLSGRKGATYSFQCVHSATDSVTFEIQNTRYFTAYIYIPYYFPLRSINQTEMYGFFNSRTKNCFHLKETFRNVIMPSIVKRWTIVYYLPIRSVNNVVDIYFITVSCKIWKYDKLSYLSYLNIIPI